MMNIGNGQLLQAMIQRRQQAGQNGPMAPMLQQLPFGSGQILQAMQQRMQARQGAGTPAGAPMMPRRPQPQQMAPIAPKPMEQDHGGMGPGGY